MAQKVLLKHNSIIVFTGANNSGKSQVLKDIENSLNASDKTPRIVVKNSECEYCGTIAEKTFFNKRFYMNQQGEYQSFELVYSNAKFESIIGKNIYVYNIYVYFYI